MFDPTITEKAEQLTMLQRQNLRAGKDQNSSVPQVAKKQPDKVETRVLKLLLLVKRRQLEKKAVLKKSLGCRSD